MPMTWPNWATIIACRTCNARWAWRSCTRLDGWVAARQKIAALLRRAFAQPAACGAALYPSGPQQRLSSLCGAAGCTASIATSVFAALRARRHRRQCPLCAGLSAFLLRARGYMPGLCPVAERAVAQILTLPMFPAMTRGRCPPRVVRGALTRATAKAASHFSVPARRATAKSHPSGKRPSIRCRRARISSSSPTRCYADQTESDFRPRQHKTQRRRQWRGAGVCKVVRTASEMRRGVSCSFSGSSSRNSNPCRNSERAWISTPISASRAKVPSVSKPLVQQAERQLHHIGPETRRQARRDRRRHRPRCRSCGTRLRSCSRCSAGHSASPSAKIARRMHQQGVGLQRLRRLPRTRDHAHPARFSS